MLKPNRATPFVASTSLIERRRNCLDRIRANQRSIRSEILSQFPEEADLIRSWRESLRRVLIIRGGPRCGTSAMHSLLAQHKAIASLPGEHRAYFTLLRHNFPDHGQAIECDNVESLPDDERQELLDMIFVSAQVGQPLVSPGPREIYRFALEWALRLPLQWPELEIDPARIVDAISAVTRERVESGKSCANAEFDLEILRTISKLHVGINPIFYDNDAEARSGIVTKGYRPIRAPSSLIVEITPFTVLRPRQVKTHDCGIAALLLKSSSDAYRLATMRGVFSDWDVRAIHLTRNPIASVNGLIDGWNHHGFWQHELSFMHTVPADRTWWSFDLMDEWHQIVESPIQEIARAQWFDSNRRILESAMEPKANEIWSRVAFEQFTEGVGARMAMVRQIFENASIAPELTHLETAVRQPKVVNRSAVPRADRWRDRAHELLPIMKSQETRALVEALGYKHVVASEWH